MAARRSAILAILFFWAPLLRDLLSPFSTGAIPAWLTEALARMWEASAYFQLAALAFTAIALANARGWSRPASVTVDARWLHVTVGRRGLRIRRETITNGVVRAARSPEVELELSTGRTIRIQLSDEEEAHALIAALKLGSDQRRAKIPLGKPSHVVWRGIASLFGSIVLVFIVIGQVPATLLSLFREHLFLFWFASMLAALHALRTPDVTVGAEGLVIRTPWRTRYVAYARVAHLFADGREIVLRLTDRTKVSVHGWSTESARAVIRRVTEARERAEHAEPGGRTDWLERRGRSFADWRASVIGSLRPSSGYRAAVQAPGDALQIVENPAAPLEHRIGAALALVGSREAGAAKRIRVAARASANDKVRIALEQAAEDAADEAAIEDALAEARREDGARRAT